MHFRPLLPPTLRAFLQQNPSKTSKISIIRRREPIRSKSHIFQTFPVNYECAALYAYKFLKISLLVLQLADVFANEEMFVVVARTRGRLLIVFSKQIDAFWKQ